MERGPNARSTGGEKQKFGRPMKLSSPQRLLCAIMYLKHNNGVVYEDFSWNWSRSSVCDDVLFVCFVINEACAFEKRWPTAQERRILGRKLP